MNERLGLVGEQALAKELLLELAAFFKRELGGRFNGVNGGQRRQHAALFCPNFLASGGEDRRVLAGRAEFVIAFASFRRRLSRHFPCERDCSGQKIAVDQTIYKPEPQGVLSGNRVAFGAHLDAFGDAHQTRQALRPACAGYDAELHFGLAQLSIRSGDAVVAGHGQLQTTAESRAVNRHYDGFG